MVDQQKMNELEARVKTLETLVVEMQRQQQQFLMAYRILYEQTHGENTQNSLSHGA